ncbi:hypothetical protein [Sphingomonas sp. TX0522]|uniref:hypothetical protein n=1 Tax=Sphingomonas sp. TX0522 TaxID=2479205 RepID=UPI0018DF6D3D|nr:hypothetical protein [Sphingomonas sp. TX0522]
MTDRRSAPRSRRPLPPQNGAQALAFLRTHGVSVKPQWTSEFGTWWLVSDEGRPVDLVGLIAIAHRKGFEA